MTSYFHSEISWPLRPWYFWYTIKRDLTWPMRPKAEIFFDKIIFFKFRKNNCDIKVPIHVCQLYKLVRHCILRNGMTQLLCDGYLLRCWKSWRLPSSRNSSQHSTLAHYCQRCSLQNREKSTGCFFCIHFIVSTL